MIGTVCIDMPQFPLKVASLSLSIRRVLFQFLGYWLVYFSFYSNNIKQSESKQRRF